MHPVSLPTVPSFPLIKGLALYGWGANHLSGAWVASSTEDAKMNRTRLHIPLAVWGDRLHKRVMTT